MTCGRSVVFSVYSIQHYVIKFVRDLRQVGGFLWVLLFFPPIKLIPPEYNWYIVESGVKHNNPNSLFDFPTIHQSTYAQPALQKLSYDLLLEPHTGNFRLGQSHVVQGHGPTHSTLTFLWIKNKVNYVSGVRRRPFDEDSLTHKIQPIGFLSFDCDCIW